MSHTIFSASPFRGGYGQAVIPLRRSAGLGDVLSDMLEAVGLEDVTGLLVDLDGLIEQIPVGALRSDYEKRRNACMALGTVAQYKCLYDLFQDIKNKKDEPVTPPPKTPPGTAGQAQSTFPWTHVGIAAGVGVAALLYFAFKK